MKCSKCNQEIDADGLFCEYCGARIERTDSIQPQGKAPIEDRVGEFARKTVGGVANKYRCIKRNVATNYPIIRERVANTIKKVTDTIVAKFNEIISNIKLLK